LFGSKGGWTKKFGAEKTKVKSAILKIHVVLVVAVVKRTELGSVKDGDFATT